MRRGYARISTPEQRLDLQLDALRGAGCAELYQDTASAVAPARPGLAACLAALQEGDELVVWRLDRLARSVEHLLQLLAELAARQVAIVSLTEQLETGTATGRLMVHVLGALAEFERGLTRERIAAGITAARARGTLIGRPATLNPDQVAAVRLLAGQKSKRELARTFRCGRRTINDVLNKTGAYAHV